MCRHPISDAFTAGSKNVQKSFRKGICVGRAGVEQRIAYGPGEG
jgi:hypothetical protein